MTKTQTMPRIPRADWTKHPRFATQALLLGSHANFRRVSQHLVSQARVDGDLDGMRSLYARWKGAMAGHEGYEEHKLYPFLTRRWGASCAAAEAGHTAMAFLDLGVRAAFSARAAAASNERLVAALEAHHKALMAHLDLEEELVIPLLLELTPAEFDAYSRS